MPFALDCRAPPLHACTAALALSLALPAAALDYSSPAVINAYVASATTEKLDAALAGFDIAQAALAGATNGFTGHFASGISSIFFDGPPGLTLPNIHTTLDAASDGDLGPPGDPLLLDHTELNVLASFTSGRAVTIGAGGANIDTGGFDLSLSDVLTANGRLVKYGSGTLDLTGANAWHVAPLIREGTLRGNSTSLATDIDTSVSVSTTVEFDQSTAGNYDGAIRGGGTLRKAGAGTLLLTAANPYSGGTVIDAGTLALGSAGRIGDGQLAVAAGASFDVAAARDSSGDPLLFKVGSLSGAGDILLGPNHLETEFAADASFDGRITGDGGLIVRSNSQRRLTLGNTQAYRGVTKLNNAVLALAGGGTLDAASDVSIDVNSVFDLSAADGDREVAGLDGSGTVALGARTLTLGGAGALRHFDGTISGTGGLRKIGAGRQQLRGTALYTGPTRIEDGTLAVHPAALGPEVIDEAELEFEYYVKDDPARPIAAYSGSISGSGVVSKTGDGIVWLRGVNSYSGGTVVHGGALVGNTASLQGDIDVGDGASVAFYQIDDGSYAGTIGGGGALLKYGPGRVHLAGSNTHSGGTAFSGPLRIDDDSSLGAADAPLAISDGTLELSHDTASARPLFLAGDNAIDTRGFDLVLSGPSAGAGRLTKLGAGSLAIQGHHAHTGLTQVTGGVLVLAGSLAGATAIEHGARLSGNGSIAGDLLLAPGSAYAVAVDAAGRSSAINVGGTAAVAGSTLEVHAATGDYAASTNYTVLRAAGGIVGQFAGATTDLALLTPALRYESTEVILTLLRNQRSYADFALTADQRSIGSALAALDMNPDGDARDVVGALQALTAPEIPGALEAIGGLPLSGIARALHLQQRALGQQISARLGALGGGNAPSALVADVDRGLLLAMADGEDARALPVLTSALAAAARDGSYAQRGAGLWLRGLAGIGEVDVTTRGEADLDTAGVVGGFDWMPADTLTLGLYGAYTGSDLEQNAPISDTTIASWRFGAYGRWQGTRFNVDARIGYGQDDFETRRRIALGPMTRTARGDFDGETWGAYLEVAHAWRLDDAGGHVLKPYFALQWTAQEQDAYRETGAGALNLALPRTTVDSVRTLTGLRLNHGIARTRGLVFSAEVRAAWAHEMADQGTVSARLAGDRAGTLFRIRGQQVARDSAVLGGGLQAATARGLRLFADVDAELNSAQRSFGVSAGLRYAW